MVATDFWIQLASQEQFKDTFPYGVKPFSSLPTMLGFVPGICSNQVVRHADRDMTVMKGYRGEDQGPSGGLLFRQRAEHGPESLWRFSGKEVASQGRYTE